MHVNPLRQDHAAASGHLRPVLSRHGPGMGLLAGGSGNPVWVIGLAAILLTWPALWNGYPLVFADTGTYLGQALQQYVGWDRPPFYSLFLHALHWRMSLWPVVAAQGLLLAHLLYLVLRVQGHAGPVPLLLTALGLAMFTGLPFIAAQLMPDVFTGVVVLCAWLIGFRQAALSTAERRYVLLLASLAVVVHQSHVPLALGLAAVGAMLTAAQGLRPALRAFGRMAVPPVLAMLALVAVNVTAHHAPGLSPYGSVFLATRMLFDETGQAWLARHCPSEEFRICGVVGQLGVSQLGIGHNHFLWDPAGPQHTQLGGPKAWAAEASAIVRGVVLEDPLGVLRAAVANTLEQMSRSNTGDGLGPWLGLPGPEPLIERFFPAEHAAFLAARQQRGTLLPLAERLAPLHAAVFYGALLVLLAALAWTRQGASRRGASRRGASHLAATQAATPRGPMRGEMLTALVLAALLGNAAITGALSGPADRYQARITWLALIAVVAVVLPRKQVLLPVVARPGGPIVG